MRERSASWNLDAGHLKTFLSDWRQERVRFPPALFIVGPGDGMSTIPDRANAGAGDEAWQRGSPEPCCRRGETCFWHTPLNPVWRWPEGSKGLFGTDRRRLALFERRGRIDGCLSGCRDGPAPALGSWSIAQRKSALTHHALRRSRSPGRKTSEGDNGSTPCDHVRREELPCPWLPTPSLASIRFRRPCFR